MSESTEPSQDPAPPATSLPTGDPVPSAAASVAAPAPKAKPLPLKALLQAAPSNVDAFLAHLQRCLQTPSGVDTCLLLACYSTRLTGTLLEYLTGPAIQRGAEQLIALASSLPPSATLVFSAKSFPSPSVAAILEISKRLKAFAAMISEGRMFLRLWGLIGLYFWARGLVFKLIASRKAASASSGAVDDKSSSSPPPPKESFVDTTIAWTQLLSCIIFQTLENRAFLAGKGVIPLTGPAQVSTFRWATRFWGTFIGIEIGRLLYENHKRRRAGTPASRASVDGSGEADKSSLAALEQEDREWTDSWRKSLARNCAWFPLTVHWSLEQGLISELAVGALPLIPGVIQIRELWRRTAA
ncbi:peroxin-11C [Microdochium nivale]|nr:peroxin-11C [Microdochium nivale]